jgi:hypothetical protein
VVFGIEAASFDHGSQPCDAVLRAVDEAARRIADEVRA